MASEALPVTSLSTEKIKGIHAKASSLCSARLYNKSTFLSSVQVVWFGQPGDRFPFAVDADLNMKTRISFALMKEKFPFKIFRDPPAFTNTCSAFSRHFHFGYCEVRGHNDEQYNVKKTAEYLNTHQWVGVIHISDDSKLYLIPTSTLSQDLGITQPSYPARILHGLFAKKRPRSSESVPRPSQAPTHPPDTITTKPDSKFPLQKSSLENQALPGSGPGLEGTSTRKRRRVTFASEPSSSGDVETPGAGGASDVSPPATSGTETSATVAEALTQGTSQTQQRQTLPPFTLKLEAAAATPGGPDQARPPPWTQQSAPLIKVKEEPLESLRELFAHVEKQSDEESIASSISSATSDVVKPKKRRGGRRPGPRGRRKASGTQKAGEAEVKGTGTRGRKRQYQGRGGRASVGTKVVEEESPDAETIKKRRLSLDIVPFVATKGIARDGANLLYQILDEQTIVIEEVTQELPTEMVSTSPAAQGTQATEEELQVEAGTSQHRNIEAEGGHLTSPHPQNIKLAKDPSVLAVSTAPAVAMQQEEQQQLRQEQELQEEPLPPPSQQQQQQQQVQVQQQVQQQQQQQQVQQQVQQQQQVQGLKQQQEEQQQLLAQQQQQQALKQQQEIQLQTQQQALKQQQLQAQQQALKQQEQLQTQQQALKQQQQQLQTQQQALKQQQQLQTQQQQQALKQQQLQTQQQALKQQQQLLQTQQHQALQEQQQQLQTQQQQQAQKQQQQPQGHKQQQQLPKQIQQQQLQGQPLKQQPNLQQQKQQPPPLEQPKRETTSSDMAAPIPTNTDGYERSAAADAVRRRLVSESSEIEEEVISLPTQSTEMSVEVTTEVPDAPSESSRAPHVQGVPRKVSLAEYKARRRSTIEDIRPRRDSGGTEPEVAETQKSASQLAERVDGSGGKSIPVADGQTKMKPSPVKLSPLLKGTETRQLTGVDSSPKDSLSAARQSVSVKPAPDRSADPRAAAALGKGTPTTPAPKSGRELPAPSLPKSLVSLASSKLTDDSHAGGAASEKPKPKDASPEPPKITAPITLTSWPSTTPPPPTSSFHSSSSSSPSVSRALFSSIPVHRSVPLKDSPPRPRFHLPPPHPPLPPLHPPPPPHGPFFPPHPGFPHPQAPPPAGHPPFYTPPHPHRIPPPTPWGAYNYFTSQHGGFPYLQAGLVDYSSRSSQDDASPRPPRSPDSPPRSPSRSPSPSGSSSRSFHSGTPTGENSPIDEERDLMQPRIMQFSAGDSKGGVGGGGGGVALDSVNSEPVIHGNHRDYGIQASRDTASQVVQVGHGFKFRSIRTQTARPAATESTGIQCCPKTYNVRIQAEPIPLLSSFSQTPKVHLKNTATQTREPKKPPVADVPEEEQQEKKTTKEEKTSALESLQNLILGMEAPRIDSVLKKVRDFLSAQLDDMVDQHESGRGDAATPRGSNSDYDPVDMSCDDDLTGNEDDVFEADSQPGDNVPSPVISGASNISEGDLSELFSGTPSPSTSKGAMSEPYSPTHPLDPDENYSLNDCSKFTNSAGVSDGKGKKSLEEPTMVITGDGVGTTVASSSQEPLKLPTKPSSKQSTALSPPLPAPTGEDRIPDPKIPSGETKPVVRLLVIPHHRLQQQQRPNELSPVPEMETDRGESAPLHPDSRVDVQRGPPSAPLPAHPPVIPCTFAGTCSSPWELPPRSLPSGAGLQLEPTLSPVLPEPSLLPSKPKQECSPQKTQLGVGPSPALRPSDDDAGDEVWYVRAFSLPPIKLGGPKSSTRSTPSTPSPSSPEKTLGLIAGRTTSDSSAVQSHPSPRRAISNSPPCPRKSSGMIPTKKRPPLTAAELLAKVRAKKTPPPPQQPQRQQPRETHCGGNGLLSTIEERHTEEEVTPPPAIEGDYSGRNGTKTGPIDMNQLMQNFHRHMAARNVLDTSWIKNYRAFCPPPPPPPPPAYSSLPQVPIVFPFAMYQRMPLAAASLPSPPHWVDGCKTGASAQISQTEEDRTPPLGSPSAPADLHHGSKSSTPTLDEDRMSVDLQQEMQGALVGLALAAERHLLQQPVEQVSMADEQAGRDGGSTQETGEPSTAGAVEVAEKCSKVGGESTIVRLPFPAPLDGSPPLLPEERPGDSHVFRTASSSQVAEDSDDRPGTVTEMELGPDLVCGVDKTSPRPPLQPDPVPDDDLLDSPHSTPSPPEVLRSAGSPTDSLERAHDSPGTPYFSLPNSPATEAAETPTSTLWFTPQQQQVAECLPSQKTDQPRARRSTLVPMTPLFDWKELEEVPKEVLPQSSGGGGMLGPGPTSPPSFLSDGSMEYMEQQERGTIAHELSEVKDDVSELPQLSPSTEEEAAEMIVREQPLMAPDICDEQRGEDPPQVELSRMESESESTSNTCREGGGEGSDEIPTLCSESRNGSVCGHDSIRSSGTPACEPVMREDVKPEKVAVEQSRGHGSGESATTGRFEAGTWEPTAAIPQVEGTAAEGCMDAPLSSVENQLWEHSTTATPVPQKEYNLGTAGDEAVSEQESEGGLRHYDLVPSKVLENSSQEALPESVPLPVELDSPMELEQYCSSSPSPSRPESVLSMQEGDEPADSHDVGRSDVPRAGQEPCSSAGRHRGRSDLEAAPGVFPPLEEPARVALDAYSARTSVMESAEGGTTEDGQLGVEGVHHLEQPSEAEVLAVSSQASVSVEGCAAETTTMGALDSLDADCKVRMDCKVDVHVPDVSSADAAMPSADTSVSSEGEFTSVIVEEESQLTSSSAEPLGPENQGSVDLEIGNQNAESEEHVTHSETTTASLPSSRTGTVPSSQPPGAISPSGPRRSLSPATTRSGGNCPSPPQATPTSSIPTPTPGLGEFGTHHEAKDRCRLSSARLNQSSNNSLVLPGNDPCQPILSESSAPDDSSTQVDGERLVSSRRDEVQQERWEETDSDGRVPPDVEELPSRRETSEAQEVEDYHSSADEGLIETGSPLVNEVCSIWEVETPRLMVAVDTVPSTHMDIEGTAPIYQPPETVQSGDRSHDQSGDHVNPSDEFSMPEKCSNSEELSTTVASVRQRHPEKETMSSPVNEANATLPHHQVLSREGLVVGKNSKRPAVIVQSCDTVEYSNAERSDGVAHSPSRGTDTRVSRGDTAVQIDGSPSSLEKKLDSQAISSLGPKLADLSECLVGEQRKGDHEGSNDTLRTSPLMEEDVQTTDAGSVPVSSEHSESFLEEGEILDSDDEVQCDSPEPPGLESQGVIDLTANTPLRAASAGEGRAVVLSKTPARGSHVVDLTASTPRTQVPSAEICRQLLRYDQVPPVDNSPLLYSSSSSLRPIPAPRTVFSPVSPYLADPLKERIAAGTSSSLEMSQSERQLVRFGIEDDHRSGSNPDSLATSEKCASRLSQDVLTVDMEIDSSTAPPLPTSPLPLFQENERSFPPPLPSSPPPSSQNGGALPPSTPPPTSAPVDHISPIALATKAITEPSTFSMQAPLASRNLLPLFPPQGAPPKPQPLFPTTPSPLEPSVPLNETFSKESATSSSTYCPPQLAPDEFHQLPLQPLFPKNERTRAGAETSVLHPQQPSRFAPPERSQQSFAGHSFRTPQTREDGRDGGSHSLSPLLPRRPPLLQPTDTCHSPLTHHCFSENFAALSPLNHPPPLMHRRSPPVTNHPWGPPPYGSSAPHRYGSPGPPPLELEPHPYRQPSRPPPARRWSFPSHNQDSFHDHDRSVPFRRLIYRYF